MSQPANNEITVHIFLDLDGVIADFDLHAITQNKKTPDGKMKWDELDHKWWATMPMCAGAKELYAAAVKLGITKFLTGPTVGQECFSGKAAWVQGFSPKGKFGLKDLIICSSGDKHYLAGPDRILVDDRESNVREWEAAGGIGIHHKGDIKATIKALELAVEKLTITMKTSASKLPAPRKNPCAPGF